MMNKQYRDMIRRKDFTSTHHGLTAEQNRIRLLEAETGAMFGKPPAKVEAISDAREARLNSLIRNASRLIINERAI